MNPYQPHHRLSTIDVSLTLPPHDDLDGPIIAVVRGRSATKRVNLWIESGTWDASEPHRQNNVADWVQHVILCAVQDRPNSTERLMFSLTGGLAGQDQLPF